MQLVCIVWQCCCCTLSTQSRSFNISEYIWFSMRDNESDNLIQLFNFRRSIATSSPLILILIHSLAAIILTWNCRRRRRLPSIEFNRTIAANIASKCHTISIWYQIANFSQLMCSSAFYITQTLFTIGIDTAPMWKVRTVGDVGWRSSSNQKVSFIYCCLSTAW